MVKTYHHTKLELICCLGFKETVGFSYSLTRGPVATSFDLADLYMFQCMYTVRPYHHTKLELIGCLGSKETARPLYSP